VVVSETIERRSGEASAAIGCEATLVPGENTIGPSDRFVCSLTLKRTRVRRTNVLNMPDATRIFRVPTKPLDRGPAFVVQDCLVRSTNNRPWEVKTVAALP
jgi:hypothetical protein